MGSLLCVLSLANKAETIRVICCGNYELTENVAFPIKLAAYPLFSTYVSGNPKQKRPQTQCMKGTLV